MYIPDARALLTLRRVTDGMVIFLISLFTLMVFEKFFFDEISSLSMIGAIIATVAGVLWVRSETMIVRGSNRIVLHNGDYYGDIGVGPISIGSAKLWHRVLDYDPKMRTVEKAIRLQAKDGSFISTTLVYTWKPDQDDLAAFFSDNQESRIDQFVRTMLQVWAKEISPQQIFSQLPTSIKGAIAGIHSEGPVLSNFLPDGDEDMSRHIRDNTHLIQSIVNEVEDENRIESLRAVLKDAYSDRHQRIDSLCDQRKAELRRRSLRA